MIETWQAKCLHQNALLVHDIWHRHCSVCDQDVHFVQYRKLLYVLDEYRRDSIDVFAVVKANALCLCHLLAKHQGDWYRSSLCMHAGQRLQVNINTTCLPMHMFSWQSTMPEVVQPGTYFLAFGEVDSVVVMV